MDRRPGDRPQQRSRLNERDGRANLPAIRKEEAVRAGRILGIAHHYFLDQKDLGFATAAEQADSSNWDRAQVGEFLNGLLAREHYDAVFTLPPNAQTHGHHRAATQLAQEAVARIPKSERPLLFGAEARSRGDAPNYQIVVNWVIAEHKPQGLFQMEFGKHELEQLWLLDGGGDKERRLRELHEGLCS